MLSPLTRTALLLALLPAAAEPAPAAPALQVDDLRAPPALVRAPAANGGQRQLQVLVFTVRNPGGPRTATVTVTGPPPIGRIRRTTALAAGEQQLEIQLPAVAAATDAAVRVEADGCEPAAAQVRLRPVRPWVVYLLPHSHVDIGYTQLQPLVEQDQWRFIDQAMDAAQQTQSFGPDATFKWNVEVLWAVDSYLRRASPEKKQRFMDAVRRGWIGLDALYGNELTALCRDAELYRLLDFAGRVSRQCGVPIESAMITDVPGATWGLTAVLTEAGVRYLAMGPNSRHRIGRTHVVWDDKPFWWETPCGRRRLLCWIPEQGYYRTFQGGAALLERLARLDEQGYPYDILQIRYCLGDNRGPGIELARQVRDWNAKYAAPRLVIATTREAMRQFERRYGDRLPVHRGDFTPYWEDGAASSAKETALNRNAAERLARAEALWAMLRDPQTYPDAGFYAAWRNVLLYDEHTWGAYCSISRPHAELTLGQWRIKQAFAWDADRQSRDWLERAAAVLSNPRRREPGPLRPPVDLIVLNANSFPVTDLVVVSPVAAEGPCGVRDAAGRPAPAQRLSTGELAFLAEAVPPFGGKRYRLERGDPARPAGEPARVSGRTLANGLLSVRLDPRWGDIVSLTDGAGRELAAARAGLNSYVYVPGRDPANAVRNGPVRIEPRDRGPLVASLAAVSDAPGCRRLVREVRLIAGLGRVEIRDVLDKQEVYQKEAVHVGFAFQVPRGVMRMDAPLAIVRPEADQLPGACKNYFTVQRWVDVSNEQYGATWTTLDSPLVEVGDIRMDVANPFDPEAWVERLAPSQRLFAYVMNNYWETNYKAAQGGEHVFRFAIRPHAGPFNPAAAVRFAMQRSRPLVWVARSPGSAGPGTLPSRLRIEPRTVVVTSLKPTNDGRGWIVRLWNPTAQPASVRLHWRDPGPERLWLSDAFERRRDPAPAPLVLPPMAAVSLRAE